MRYTDIPRYTPFSDRYTALGIYYPAHRHEPLEMYHVISGEARFFLADDEDSEVQTATGGPDSFWLPGRDECLFWVLIEREIPINGGVKCYLNEMKLWNTNKSEQHIDVHTCIYITMLSWILLFWFKQTTRSLNFSHGHSARSSRLHQPYQAHGMQTFEKAVLILWGWIGNLKDYDFHYLPSDWLKGPPWKIGILDGWSVPFWSWYVTSD